MKSVTTQIIQIGNSRGVRLPKLLLDQVSLSGEVEISVEDDQIVIRSATRPRANWDRQFQVMAERGDDKLLDESTPTQWDEDEWTW
ncbi:MAG: hypothetical protein WEB58_21915 [Planctomycetaceae bacterium]